MTEEQWMGKSLTISMGVSFLEGSSVIDARTVVARNRVNKASLGRAC
jgi:hypothetical protein